MPKGKGKKSSNVIDRAIDKVYGFLPYIYAPGAVIKDSANKMGKAHRLSKRYAKKTGPKK